MAAANENGLSARLREIARDPDTKPALAVQIRTFADDCERIGIRNMEEATIFALGMITALLEAVDDLRARDIREEKKGV